jgi:hypothetical protein
MTRRPNNRANTPSTVAPQARTREAIMTIESEGAANFMNQ